MQQGPKPGDGPITKLGAIIGDTRFVAVVVAVAVLAFFFIHDNNPSVMSQMQFGRICLWWDEDSPDFCEQDLPYRWVVLVCAALVTISALVNLSRKRTDR
jgi:hypothetical protein